MRRGAGHWRKHGLYHHWKPVRIIVGRELYQNHIYAGEFGVMPVGVNGAAAYKIASTSGYENAASAGAACRRDAACGCDLSNEWRPMFICVRRSMTGGSYLSRGVYSVISKCFDPGVVPSQENKRTGKALPALTRHLETFEMWRRPKADSAPANWEIRASRLCRSAGAAKLARS